MALSKAARVILVGAPGVGKGTQSARLLQQFPELSSIASGDLLRANVRKQTAIGLQAQKLMQGGALVPDAMILQLITSELTTRGWLKAAAAEPYTLNYASQPTLDSSSDFAQSRRTPYETSDKPSASFLLDGFPRTALQATQLDALIPMNLVVHISTPAAIIIDRIANRWVHSSSGRVYNTTFNPPKVPGKDDVTGEELTKRDDDSPEVWERRLRQFHETSQPLLDHYNRKGVLWTVEGNSSDEISPKLFDEFAKRFCGTVSST